VMTEAGTTQFGRRLSNTVQYWTPTIGGFQARIATQFTGHKSPEGPAAVDPGLWSASLSWTTGAFALGAAYERHKDFTAPGTRDSGFMIGGKWTGGPISIGAAVEQLDYDPVATGTEFKRRNFVVNGAFNVGAGQLFAGYSWTPGNRDCGPALTAVCDSDATEARMISAGYAHNLSKRTKAYVQFLSIDNESAQAFNIISAPPGNAVGGTGGIVAGTDIRALGVGVQHSF
jgi:predicted porin